jgi:hypothetical protein
MENHDDFTEFFFLHFSLLPLCLNSGELSSTQNALYSTAIRIKKVQSQLTLRSTNLQRSPSSFLAFAHNGKCVRWEVPGSLFEKYLSLVTAQAQKSL